MKVLVMCLADVASSPRPSRIIRLLASQGHTIDLLGLPMTGKLPIREHFEIHLPMPRLWQRAVRFVTGVCAAVVIRLMTPQPRIAARFIDWRYALAGAEGRLRSEDYDLIVVEDIQLLPLAFRARKQAKVMFDAREFYIRQNDESLRFRWFERPLRMELCRYYLPQCDILVTVSPGLARAYASEFGLKMELLRSTPNYREMPVPATEPGRVRMVHHGEANRNRGIGNMIEIVRRLDDRFTLDLYLTGSASYIEELRSKSRGCERIRILEPVPFDEILPTLNKYDVGFYYLRPVGFNVTFNLPNKLFEFIQARLAVAIGPSPDMAEVVSAYDCGFVAPEFSLESMQRTLSGVTPAMVDRAKRNSDRAARELCYERESARVLTIINQAGRVGQGET